MQTIKKLVAGIAFLWALCNAQVLLAQSAVTFPTLPDSADWMSDLWTVFTSAAALGLGILGLGLVIRMIRRGLKAR